MPSFLTILFCFQLGWIPMGELIYYQPNESVFTGGIYNQFDATFKIDATIFDCIVIGGDVICKFAFNNKDKSTFAPFNFMPTGMDYLIYIGLQITKDFFIKYEHSCSHPVATYFNLYNGSSALDSGYDRVYIEIKGSLINPSN